MYIYINIPNQYPTLCLQLFTYIYHFFRTAFVRRHVGDLYLGKKSDGFRATEVLRRGRGMDALGSRGGG